ncbi:serpin family protein [Vermiculatibacterium agrestimuris]|uniref:serpin family protein n=1 Tax=Vermiculatibacterium agrestimuris TaxID=2941519 RepID=UPI00203BAF5E|nr:serpin family protein [Vermiculatibacterium agrestimuris]
MKKRFFPLLLSFSLLSGCAAGAVSPVPTPSGSVSPVELIQNDPQPIGAAVCLSEGLGETYSAFALELLRQSRTEGENALLSPLSVLLALGMTANGADGDTLAQFATALGMGRDALNSLCARFLADYSGLGGSTESTLLNSLWADPDLTLNDPFVLRCQDTYKAQLFKADLQSPATVQALNDWVSDATRGLIPSIVDEFDDRAVLALVNAIYLKNKFETPFPEPHSEWTIDFHNADGSLSQPRGMSAERTMTYLSREDAQGVVLPYDDGRLGLLLLLPDEGMGLTDCLSAWDGATLSGLLAGREERQVDLVMPKFKAEWSGSLAEPLAAMGLTDAFDPNLADFTSMGACSDGPLYMGDVIHKTAFEVNEKGTEAAAVTAVIMEAGSAMPPQDMIVLRYDRPFVYGIVDLELGVPLFLGTMEHMD